MYYPYLRGKQYELITLRECSEIIKQSGIIPIIEPVKSNLSSLIRALESLINHEIEFILVLNPKFGDLKSDPTILETDFIESILKSYDKFSIGYIVNAQSSLIDIRGFLSIHKEREVSLIHYDYPKAKKLKYELENFSNVNRHIFVDGYSGKLYQKNFKKDGITRVLLRDGFKRRRNADYPEDEHFSDLNVTYEDEGMNGFGDFLIVGDDYSDSGGPAYAVAIHLTYLDEDDDMRIRHFISDRADTPVDPAGKFFEALEKLVQEVSDPDTLVLNSNSIKEYKKLYDSGHFPGLGYVKKLSMNHHIELIAKFILEQ